MAVMDLIRKPRTDEGAAGKNPETQDPRATRKRAIIICAASLPLLLALYALLLWWSAPHTPGRQLRIDEYYSLIDRQAIKDATANTSDGRIVGSYQPAANGSTQRYWVSYGGSETFLTGLVKVLTDANIPTKFKQQPLKNLVAPVSFLLPAFMIVDGMFLIFLIFGRGGEGYQAYGKSGHRRVGSGDSKITFADVAGIDEAIEELGEVRDYLVSPARFLALGATVPKGLLLSGEPGCGKTLLARALAGEANVPFFSISGSEFVEIFVGVGASRIRDFFKVAKANAPCIVFIDELDAVGRSRTVTAMGGADEREATLNQLLVEMDGFESGSGVVVVAATNRPDILDSALLRPGRFDRRLTIDRPDIRGREGILGIHTRGKPLGPDVDLHLVARSTPGFTGADLANVVNEAALLTARRGGTAIGQRNFSEAVERLMAGPERRSRILSPSDRKRIAYHEAGHAVAASGAPGAGPVRKLSIVARNHSVGFTWFMPDGDQQVSTRSELVDRITGVLGGRAAEELVFGEVSNGSTSDLELAGSMARRMVMEFGMSERMGPFSAKPYAMAGGGDGVNAGYSEKVATEIDAEIRRVLNEANEAALAIMREHRHVLEAVAVALMESETLEGDTLDALLLSLGRPGLAPSAR